MARNEERRRALADAGLTVLATTGGARGGLTHRAVDREAGVPQGTTTNYFRNRSALLQGLVERIGERLAPPSEEFIAERTGLPPSRQLFGEYLRNIVERLLANREVTIALIELRLEGIRDPRSPRSSVSGVVPASRGGTWLQRAGGTARYGTGDRTVPLRGRR